MNFQKLPDGAGNSPSEEALTRIETALLLDLKPSRPVPSARRMILGLLASAVLVVAAAVGRLGLSGWKSSSWLQGSVILGILLLGMSLVAHSLSGQVVPGSKRPYSPAFVLLVPLAVLATALIILFPAQPESNFLSVGFRCWRAGLACAAATAPLFWLMLRRGYALDPVECGATAGLLAGLTGVTVLSIECRYHDSLHLTTWHLGAALAALAIGACSGYFARSRRRRGSVTFEH